MDVIFMGIGPSLDRQRGSHADGRHVHRSQFVRMLCAMWHAIATRGLKIHGYRRTVATPRSDREV
jgi:hypothetical protein